MIDPPPAITPEKIAAAVERFLTWKLPDSVCADVCATDRDYARRYPGLRSGTNLLTADEARQMIEHLLPALLDLAEGALAKAKTESEERKEICEELGCITEPGVPLRFVRGLREDLKRAYARNDELIRSWDAATLTERQELDRLRRGWGPSTPTTHMQRWADARDFLNWIAEVEEAADIRDDDDGAPEDVETTLDRVTVAVGSARSKAAKRLGEIVARPPSAFDLSFIEGLTEMRKMLTLFVENGGDTSCKMLAQSMRLNWSTAWGDDPDRPAPPPAKGGE